MFEKVIANLLNKVLGDFIEGIEAEQLKISLFSGDVELFNLSIKPDILDNLPLPFKLKYGKVGRIFVDVPVTGLLSKPLKLEVSEIFVLVETKKYAEFDEEVIKQAFIKSVQSQLDKLEDYFKSQLEASQSESGVVMSVVNRLIDNIQVDIQNVHIRFEDLISNEKMPYAIAVSLEAIQLFTCNDKFERKFINGKNMAYKTAKLTNLQIYLDYSVKQKDKRQKLTFKELATVDTLDDIENEEILKLIVDRNEKGRDPSAEIIRWKHFILTEIKGHWKNLYLLDDFNIEVRIIYNKNPDKKNNMPKIRATMVFGSKFAENARDPMRDYENRASCIKLRKLQMACILKFLNYSQKYTQFQAGVVKKFHDKKFTESEREKYRELYEEFKQNDDKTQTKNKSRAAELREEMKKIEKDYSYETLAELRQNITKEALLEIFKQVEEKNLEKEIASFKSEKRQGFIGKVFAPKTEEEKDEIEEEIDEYVEKRYAELDQKFREHKEEVLEEQPIFDLTSVPTGMDTDWVQIDAEVIIPSIEVQLLNDDEVKFIELVTSELSTRLKLGGQFINVSVKLGVLDIKDYVSNNDKYPYLIHTVRDQFTVDKPAMEIQFIKNDTLTKGPIKLRVNTHCQQYIIVNFALIKALKDFFVISEKDAKDQIDFSYYGDRAKSKVLEYANIGSDYLDTISQETQVYKGLDVTMGIRTPVIIIPDSVFADTSKESLIFNVGNLTITSILQEYDPKKKYKDIDDWHQLYDEYKITFEGLQLTMMRGLGDYKTWESHDNPIDIIEKIHLLVTAKRCIEPQHPVHPSTLLFCRIEGINLFFSDYVMINMLQIVNSMGLAFDELMTDEILVNEEDRSGSLRTPNNLDAFDDSDEGQENEMVSEGEYYSEEESENESSQELDGSSPGGQNDSYLESHTPLDSSMYNEGGDSCILESSQLIASKNFEGGSSSQEEDNANVSDERSSGGYDESIVPPTDESGVQNPMNFIEFSESETPVSNTLTEGELESEEEESSNEDAMTESGDAMTESEESPRTKAVKNSPLYPSRVKDPKTGIVEGERSAIQRKSQLDLQEKLILRLHATDDRIKVDTRVLIVLDEVVLTVAERNLPMRVNNEFFSNFLDYKLEESRSRNMEVNHKEILALSIQNLDLEVELGKIQNIELSLYRILMTDLQEDEAGNGLLPSPFNKML